MYSPLRMWFPMLYARMLFTNLSVRTTMPFTTAKVIATSIIERVNIWVFHTTGKRYKTPKVSAISDHLLTGHNADLDDFSIIN